MSSIYFKYYGINDSNKDTVKSSVQDFCKKLGIKTDFLKGFNFYVVDSYEDLDKTSRLTTSAQSKGLAGGLTVSPLINEGKKEIIIKTKKNGFPIFFSNYSKSELRQIVIHEIGHQFDEYFGSCTNELKEKVSKLTFSDNDLPEDEKILSEWLHKKDLSDSKEFKEAWKVDVSDLGSKKVKNEIFKHTHFEYYPYDIDITDGVTEEEVEKSDTARSEIFSQLFSYAFGEDDGQKNAIIEKYKNCYEFVKSKITELLGINL